MTTTRSSLFTALRAAILAGFLCVVLLSLSPTRADAAGPVWQLHVDAQPTIFPPGKVNDVAGLPEYVISIYNAGTTSSTNDFTVIDVLPPGITEHGTGASTVVLHSADFDLGQVDRPSVDGIVAGRSAVAYIPVDVASLPEGTTLTNTATISGGSALEVTAKSTTTVSSDLPAFDFLSGDSAMRILSGGNPAAQAGSHPDDLTLRFGFPTHQIGTAGGEAVLDGVGGGVRQIHTALPKGVVVNVNATPVRCTEDDLNSNACPPSSQVGLMSIETAALLDHGVGPNVTPLWNMEAPRDVPALLGFNVAGQPIFVHIKGGLDGDYRLTADANDVLARFGNIIAGVRVDLWGVPSASMHDSSRGNFCIFASRTDPFSDCGSVPAGPPFLTMPGSCRDSISADISAADWDDSGTTHDEAIPATNAAGDPAPVTGCSSLDFNPQITPTPMTTNADSSSGMDVDVSLPQSGIQNAGQLAEADLKKATITLPQGIALNPSAADGLGGCTEDQIGLTGEGPPVRFNTEDPACPDASKVGSGTLDTPLLPNPLDVDLYVADPDDNPFHSLLSGYLVAHGQGITLKLAGRFDRDPDTGQITAVFDDNPELPFSDLKLHFKGGDRGVLVTPPTCGIYTTDSKLSSWSAADPEHPTPAETKDLTSTSVIDHAPGGGPCIAGDPGRAGNPFDRNALPFDPAFSAGTVSPQAGAYSPFVLKISKADGTQDLKKVAVTLPLGLTAKLAGVPRCAQSAIVPGVGGSTNCPAGSQVGTVTVGAGAGSSPFFLRDQPVYLTDGYDGAPFGLVIDTHAVAGPFDLGHVVVRTKLNIDPITAQVSGDTEPLPSIIQGIPLHIRSVTLQMDRSAFVLNPTNCNPKTVAGQLTGGGASFADPADDTVKSVTSAFQVGECASLDLKPKLAIALTGKGQTTDDKHPGVHATVSQTPGQANLKKVTVSLPLSLALDPDNAQSLCEFTDGSKIDPTCPAGSIVGHATARTPILDQPLTGPVYFVKNIRIDAKSGRQIKTLPKLVIPLTGENGLRLNLTGTSNVVDNHLVTTFDNIPDAPVSDFTLDITGGKHGILVVSGTDICKSTQTATRQVDGQNGKTADASFVLSTAACPTKIISKKVGKTSVAIKVGGLSAGKVTVSGKGIKKTTKSIVSSTVATITAKRTKGKLGKIKVSFLPAGAKKAKTVTATLK